MFDDYFRGLLHQRYEFYELLLTYVRVVFERTEIKSAIFTSRQPAVYTCVTVRGPVGLPTTLCSEKKTSTYVFLHNS